MKLWNWLVIVLLPACSGGASLFIYSLMGKTFMRDGDCPSEPFQHYYVEGPEQYLQWNNSWLSAEAGEYATLRDVCLRRNGLPVTRYCAYNEKTDEVEWEDISHWEPVHCLRETNEPIVTHELSQLRRNIEMRSQQRGWADSERKQAAVELGALLSKPNHRFLPADVHEVSRMIRPLTYVAQDANLTKELVYVMDALMSTEPSVLRLSADLNSTNLLLDSFENYVDSLSDEYVTKQHCKTVGKLVQNNNTRVQGYNYSYLGVHAEITEKLSVFFINPDCAQISGIAIYKPDTKLPQLRLLKGPHFQYRFIYTNETKEALLREQGLLAATFLPSSLWNYVRQNMVTDSPAVLIIKVYYNDVLFVEKNLELNHKVVSKILSISIPGFQGEFPELLPFVLSNYQSRFQSEGVSSSNSCGYWNYSSWSNNAVQVLSTDYLKNGLILCGTSHLTQFGFLVGGSYRQNDLTKEQLIHPAIYHSLDVISIVGCVLSFLGLFIIWLTALFPKWRHSGIQIKVLLHLCLALMMQIILFLFINTDQMVEELLNNSNAYWACVLLGALMQYCILVVFMWTLSIAYMQFKRFRNIADRDHQRPRHYVLKSAIMAWGLPLIPTLIAALVAPESYVPTEFQLRTDTGVCYPSGGALIFGVILPVFVMIVIDTIVFVYVFYKIHTALSQPLQRTERTVAKRQIMFYVFLFFVLGLPWLFGFLAFMGFGVVFSYLFCLTATLEGMVLCIYYVFLNDIARAEWSKICCRHKKKTIETSLMKNSSTQATYSYRAT